MKKNPISLSSIAVASLTTLFALSSQAASMTEDQKTFYALGQNIASSVAVFAMSPAELEQVKQGLTDGVKKNKPSVDLAVYAPKIKPLAEQRSMLAGAKSNALGAAFLDKAAKEKGAVKTPSGLVFISLKDGTGESPTAADSVTVHYRGTLIDGNEFDSSYSRNEPAEFPLTSVIKCWTEGVQKIKVGGKARLVCPASIAYGNQSMGKITPGSTLNFEVELLSIKKNEVKKDEPKK
jgi:FKBP-type peptidyl-prolyl cis-trans isomerase FkpA